MKQLRTKYRTLIISALIILGIAISIAYVTSVSKIEKANYETIRASIIETKKSFIKDTVNNIIVDIEERQNTQVQYYLNSANNIKNTLAGLSYSTSDTFFNESKNLFNKNEDFSVFIIEPQTGKIRYLSKGIHHKSNYLSADEIQQLKAASPVFSEFKNDNYQIIYYINQEIVDVRVKSQIYDQIYREKFSNNAYIWVNEVVNFNGGENYAIRRIHPNLKDTEGMYLSTSMTDIKGNHPYLTELEGVKKDGELFFNYFFVKKNSSIVSEKITYAKLYKKYNWVIAMGMHLDDITAYVDKSALQHEQSLKNNVITVAAITLFLTALVLVFFTLMEKWYFKNTTRVYNDGLYKDSLTGSYNRRGADNRLNSAFLHYKTTGQNAAVIMFDIDNFKQVNDMCGHDKGDLVLKQTVEILNQNIRSTDYLCRWGGDEFLIICNGLRKENAISFANKLSEVVMEPEFECANDNTKHHITISVGVSYFTDTDMDCLNSIKRADQALYRSKAKGKNCVTAEL